MKFIECSHPDVEGTAMFAEVSLPHQKKKGWVPVKAKSAYKPELVEPVEKHKSESKPKVKKTESPDE